MFKSVPGISTASNKLKSLNDRLLPYLPEKYRFAGDKTPLVCLALPFFLPLFSTLLSIAAQLITLGAKTTDTVLGFFLPIPLGFSFMASIISYGLKLLAGLSNLCYTIITLPFTIVLAPFRLVFGGLVSLITFPFTIVQNALLLPFKAVGYALKLT
jgi:hypothetical protein